MLLDRRFETLAVVAYAIGLSGFTATAEAQPRSAPAYQFNDSHFHLTNYVQQGIEPRDFLKIMGTRVSRSTLFGIPLQQQWSYAN